MESVGTQRNTAVGPSAAELSGRAKHDVTPECSGGLDQVGAAERVQNGNGEETQSVQHVYLLKYGCVAIQVLITLYTTMKTHLNCFLITCVINVHSNVSQPQLKIHKRMLYSNGFMQYIVTCVGLQVLTCKILVGLK